MTEVNSKPNDGGDNFNEEDYEFLASHEAYLILFSDVKGEVPSYFDWKRCVDHLRTNKDAEIDKDKADLLGFVVPAFRPAIAPLTKLVPDVLAGGLGSSKFTIVDDLVKAGTEALNEQLRQRVDQAFKMQMPSDEGISGVGDGGDGGTTQENYSGGSSYNPTGLSLNARPINSSFRTNIVPYYRPKFYLDGRENSAPLILKVLNVFPEWQLGGFCRDGILNDYMKIKIMSDWTNSISSRVRLNSFSSPLINQGHVTNFITTISYSLAVYYSYASIISHFLLNENRNEAMVKLYETLSVEDLNRVFILKQVLNNLPIDPRINEFMFHLYGNYKQSSLPGSPLVKFIAFPFASTDQNFFTQVDDQVTNCLNLLEATPFKDFNQVYAQAYPELLSTELLGYTGIPEHDPNWLSCWVNAPYMGNNGSGTVRTPSAATDTERVHYNLYTDAPDGWIDGASGIYNTTGTVGWRSGFGAFKAPRPDATGDVYFQTLDQGSGWIHQGIGLTTSCYIYREDELSSTGNVGRAFFPISLRESSQVVAANTHNVHLSSPNVSHFQRALSEKVEPRTMIDSSILCQQFADWMYTPPSMRPSDKVSQITKGLEDSATEMKSKSRRRRKR